METILITEWRIGAHEYPSRLHLYTPGRDGPPYVITHESRTAGDRIERDTRMITNSFQTALSDWGQRRTHFYGHTEPVERFDVEE